VRARIVIVQEQVLQYRQRFYELLRPRLTEGGIELSLIHSNPPPQQDIWQDTADVSWAQRVEARSIPIAGRRLIWQRFGGQLQNSDLIIVEQATRHLSTYLLMLSQVAGHRRVAMWGHGRNFDQLRSSPSAEWLKARMSTAAHWWFAYTDLSADIVTALGYPRERVTVVQNALDTHELTAAVETIDAGSSRRFLSALGLSGRHLGAYVGKLADSKRLDFLFDAADVIRERTGDFELVIAGAGVHEPTVRDYVESRPWTRYLGPLFGPGKAELLRSAQLLLIPSWAGLVVLDAFASGVPLVASADLLHPPEVSYIESGVNGLLVSDRGDPQAYGLAVADLLQDRERYDRLVSGCRVARERYTVESMVERFAFGVEQAINVSTLPRRARTDRSL
jgi:L-malate glycosyltransferase